MVGVRMLHGLAVLSSILFVTSFPMSLSFEELPLCPNIRTDLIIAIPASNRTYSENFETHLIQLMTYFNISVENFHIGLLIYGTETITVLSPSRFKNHTEVNSGITKLSRRNLFHTLLSDTGQNFIKVLEKMREEFSTSDPGIKKKMGVIFSEGLLSSTRDDGEAVLGLASELKDSGVTLFNLGARYNGSLGYEFQRIGTDFCRLFGLGSGFSGLQTVIPFLAAAICGEADPTISIPPKTNCFPQFYASIPADEFRCPGQGYFPDPNNCFYYYICPFFPFLDQSYRMSCSFGTAFNSRGCVQQFDDDVCPS